MAKKKQKGFLNWLKTKPATISFAVVALLAGLTFMAIGLGISSSGIQGNVVLDNYSSFNPSVALIGILLIFCSIVLSAYSMKQKS